MSPDTTQDAHGDDSVEAFVGELLTRIEKEGLEVLDQACADNPSNAEALRSRVGWLVERGLVTPAKETDVPRTLGSFQLLEMLGAGAMGVVHRARDVTLNREVALKLVRPEQLFFPGARERFQNEVAAVARLQHPGIVPVHSFGEQDGVPYFAMELVPGATLGDVIDHLQIGSKEPEELEGSDLIQALVELTGIEEGGSDPSGSLMFEGPWPTVVARIMLEVAEALEHAHRRSILHRDIKPSNVMITPGGRVMLVDFGLSRSEANADSSAENDRLTKTGHVVGSLAYVAPEILDGRAKANVRTDIWSLGVTFFELLSGEINAGSVDPRIRGMTLAGSLRDLREKDPRISWELETIAQTALEIDPERRYASAAEFAHDLACALSGREIVARRAGPWLRLKRWAQRHPGRSTAAVLLFLILTIGPALFGWQQARANRELAGKAKEVEEAFEETREQRDAARAALERAERNFDRASSAVDLVLNEVGDDFAQLPPRADDTRVRVLEAALALNEELLAEPESDERQARIAIEALTRIAEIRSLLGQHDEALESLVEQHRRLEGGLEGTDDSQLRALLAENLLLQGGVLNRKEDLPEALEVCHRAVAIAEQLVADDGDEFVWLLANSLMDTGQVLRFLGRVDDGRVALDRAIEQLRPVAKGAPVLSDETRLLADALVRRGSGDTWIVDPTKAGPEFDRQLAALDEAIELREKIVEANPGAPDRRRLAAALLNRGTHLGSSMFADQARLDFGRAVELAAGLVRDEPNVPIYRELHSSTLYAWCGASPEMPVAERRTHLELARSELERAIAVDPRASFRQKLMLIIVGIGAVVFDSGAIEDSLSEFEEGLSQARQLASEGLLTVPPKAAVRFAAGRRAEIFVRQGRLNEALEAALEMEAFEPAPSEVALMGWYFARCAAEVLRKTDPSLDELDDADLWVDEAIERVRRGLAAGAAPDYVLRIFGDLRLLPLLDHPRYSEFERELTD